jgi:hypothetical protein
MNKTNNVVEDLSFEIFVNQLHLIVKLRVIRSTVLRFNGCHCISVIYLYITNAILLSDNQERVKEYHINFFTPKRMLNCRHHFLL